MRTLVRLRCRGCGYGVSAREEPERCPMCHGTAWEHERRPHLSALTHDLLHLPRREKQPSA
jgi:hypothetical protein